MAERNAGGMEQDKLEHTADRHTLNPGHVKMPGVLVDCVVVAQPDNHWQTFSEKYSPAFSAEIRVPAGAIQAMTMSARKIIARRPALELRPNSVGNPGIGRPEGIASVAPEEKE